MQETACIAAEVMVVADCLQQGSLHLLALINMSPNSADLSQAAAVQVLIKIVVVSVYVVTMLPILDT